MFVLLTACIFQHVMSFKCQFHPINMTVSKCHLINMTVFNLNCSIFLVSNM